MQLFSRVRDKSVPRSRSVSERRSRSPSDAGAEEVEERSGLFILHDCPADDKNTVDIIAIHGLGGHWKHTWEGTNSSIWLRDFLPSQLAGVSINARVMSFGYNSDTAFSKAVTDITDESEMLLNRLDNCRGTPEEKRRPIIFISHSLGGIIMKKAIILAHERSSFYGNLLQNVRAAVFFGVPHRGADSAYWASFATRLLKFGQLGFGTNSAYVTALKRKSTTFKDISAQFIERAAALQIRTFFETEMMGNQVIVDKDSAKLGLPNEKAVGISESNHRTMCKFESAQSQKYSPVWIAIQTLAQSALAPTLIYSEERLVESKSESSKTGEEVAEEREAGSLAHAGFPSEGRKSSTPESLPEHLQRLGHINGLIYGIDNVNDMLQWAVRTENTPVVVALLSEKGIGLDVNAGGFDKEPHLNVAASEGHTGIVKLLLAHGANPDDGTLNGVTPLLTAVYHGKTAVVQVLAALNITKPETVRLDAPDGNGNIPLIVAAERGHDAIVSVLLSHGANKDSRDKAGMTAMAHGAKKGYSAVVALLLADGADPNLKDMENATPLIWASCRNKLSVVRQLLAVDNIEVDTIDYENMTAFTWALERRYSVIAELLADRLNYTRPELIQEVLLWLRRRRIWTPSGSGEEDYGTL